MPIYEYRCEKGHDFELLQRFSDEAVSDCQVCGAPVRRVFHPVAVHFKGSGFYNTDYGTRKRAREMSEAKESKSDGAKDTSASDSKKSSDSKGAKADTATKKAEAKSSARD